MLQRTASSLALVQVGVVFGERMLKLRRALAAKRRQDIGICKACDVPWQGSYSGRTSLENVQNFFDASAWRQ